MEGVKGTEVVILFDSDESDWKVAKPGFKLLAVYDRT